jgi:hypothetical protein
VEEVNRTGNLAMAVGLALLAALLLSGGLWEAEEVVEPPSAAGKPPAKRGRPKGSKAKKGREGRSSTSGDSPAASGAPSSVPSAPAAELELEQKTETDGGTDGGE